MADFGPGSFRRFSYILALTVPVARGFYPIPFSPPPDPARGLYSKRLHRISKPYSIMTVVSFSKAELVCSGSIEPTVIIIDTLC